LPDDQRETIIADHHTTFHRRKEQKLKEINGRGVSIKDELQQLVAFHDQMLNKRARLNLEHDQLSAAYEEKRGTAESVVEQEPDYTADKAYNDAARFLKSMQAEYDAIAASSGTDGLLARKQVCQQRIDDIKARLNGREIAAQARQRIGELETQQREVAQQQADCERQRGMLELFVKTKVSMLERSINNHFELVTFKLFRDQINGGVEECCEAMIDGVPYGDANTASRINAGLNIINALSRQCGIALPVFIDRRESVTAPIAMNTQTIGLAVSEKDKALRVETQSQKEAA